MKDDLKLRDLSYYVESNPKPPQENIIGLFRGEYPRHVKAFKKCLLEVLKNPDKNSIAIISFYRIDIDFFKKVTGLPNFRKKTLLKHKQKMQHE